MPKVTETLLRYQDNYQNGTYDAVFVFCDTEKKPHEQYKDIKILRQKLIISMVQMLLNTL